MRKIKLECCYRCDDMTKPNKNNKKICSKCKKPYNYTKKEMKELRKKIKNILSKLEKDGYMVNGKFINSEPDARAKGEYFSVGGSDF